VRSEEKFVLPIFGAADFLTAKTQEGHSVATAPLTTDAVSSEDRWFERAFTRESLSPG
jgi:hypothetical protein